mgnify:CR=1 FL=1
MKLLAKYQNGNYTVRLFDDGTKIRMNDLDNLTPAFAESMDVTITEKCNGGCPYCYLGCTEQGKHADLTNPIFDTVHAGTEMAINANDITHPGLEDFLIKMKDKGVIVNITINQKHLKVNVDKLRDYQSRKLVWGIGISLTDSTDPILWNNGLENTVLHVIDGCLSKVDLENLSNHNVKMLILGFKHKGRGVDYYNDHKEEVDSNIEYLKNHLYDYRDKFNGFGFDNLSTLDLEVQKIVSPEQWETNHMGEEGEFTYFFDAVHNKFAISSMETEMFDKLDTFDDMFKAVRKMRGFV